MRDGTLLIALWVVMIAGFVWWKAEVWWPPLSEWWCRLRVGRVTARQEAQVRELKARALDEMRLVQRLSELQRIER